MMNIFALINFAAESKITGKLEEWVIIDQDCFKNDRCQKTKSKINGCISRVLIAATNSVLVQS